MSLVISLIALLFSAFVFAHNRRDDKRDLLLRMHEHLLTTGQQEGRRTLFEMYEQKRSPDDLTSNEFNSINYALSAYNMLGYLFHEKYISRSDIIALWGLPAARARRAAERTGFLALRDLQNREPIWPYLRELSDSVEAKEERRIILQDMLNSTAEQAD
jgi:hypothetical protein